MMRRVDNRILIQRTPVAEKESRIPYRTKPLSSTSETFVKEDGVPGAPVTELEYMHT